MKEKCIFTIGHSNRSLDELLKVLKHYKIEVLADVRSFPVSSRNPQFNKEALEIKLPESGVQYKWIEKLGGFRKEGYEGYMKTEDFKDGLEALIEIAKEKVTAVMCAEVLWFRCHRRFIASLLTKEDWKVSHIYNEKKSETHRDAEKKKKQLSLMLNDKER
ncbi:MAG: DUF488 domain-containing protein [Candidatus Dadabacteria bacterium]|nr:DUF488 domain-containing protein [Candidatus Dadabacteria bacterium]